MKSISEWCKEIHQNAIDHGWWEEPREAPELLCLLHSEVSEALEAYRMSDSDGFKEELADVAIRLFDMCCYYGIDLEKEIADKHKKNIDRPYRHGNKRC